MFTEIYNPIALYVLRSPRRFVCCHFVCPAKVSDVQTRIACATSSAILSYSHLWPFRYIEIWTSFVTRVTWNSTTWEMFPLSFQHSVWNVSSRSKRERGIASYSAKKKKKRDQNASIRSWPLLAKGRAAVYFDFLFISSCAFRYGDIGLLACSV